MEFVWMIWIEFEQDGSPYVAESAEAAVMYCIKSMIQREDCDRNEKARAIMALMEVYEKGKNEFGVNYFCHISREPVIRANKEG